MKIIDRLLKEAGYTKKFLLECEKTGRTNGMGGKGGIQWTEEARKFKYFKTWKGEKYLINLDLVSDMHDLDFENVNSNSLWESIKNFLKANYMLTVRVLELSQWTTVSRRVLIAILMMVSLNTVGIKYFNWKK